MKNYFYNATLQASTAVLIDIFDNMVIRDPSQETAEIFQKSIPIEYVPKEKIFYFLQESQNAVNLDTSLPRMSIHINSIDFDAERALNLYTTRRFNLSTRKKDLMPVPYNIEYGLDIFVKYTDHVAQILENILPWFNPNLFVKIKEQGLVELEREIKISLQSVSPNVTTEYSDDERRFIHSNLIFTMETHMYRPLSDPGVLITDFNANLTNFTHVPIVSGGFKTETVSVSGIGTKDNPSYITTIK